jgi:hypothetical protein
MPYTARISRNNPSNLVFLIDQSASMHEAWGEDSTLRKADKVADIINRFLQALSIKCAREDGVRDYYHIVAQAADHARHDKVRLLQTEDKTNTTQIEPRMPSPLRYWVYTLCQSEA